MFWFIYFATSSLLSLFFARVSKKHYLEIFFLSFATLATPAQIDITNIDYAPSLFTFFFNILLEQNFSLRPLKPLVITIPLCVVVILILRAFKRKFF
tara:strand:- start:615 stop:905 length:291 start_codon:yes stop_codon:yes gene_type:complete